MDDLIYHLVSRSHRTTFRLRGLYTMNPGVRPWWWTPSTGPEPPETKEQTLRMKYQNNTLTSPNYEGTTKCDTDLVSFGLHP